MSEPPVLRLRAALAELALEVFTSRTLSEIWNGSWAWPVD